MARPRRVLGAKGTLSHTLLHGFESRFPGGLGTHAARMGDRRPRDITIGKRVAPSEEQLALICTASADGGTCSQSLAVPSRNFRCHGKLPLASPNGTACGAALLSIAAPSAYFLGKGPLGHVVVEL